MTSISKSEWEVLRVIWSQEPVKSSIIIEVLSEELAWSPSTIKTLLSRLADKGIIASQRQGRSYLYRSLLSEELALSQQVGQIFDRICLRQHGGLLLEQLDRTPLTSEDLGAFQTLLDRKKAELVDHVPCNCIKGQCSCSHHF